jgi:phosphatidyl-myo-inositol alpha-mannosyltransferase
LKVGLYHSTLPEPGRKPGGVEQHVHRLAERLQLRGHDVTVASFVRPPRDSAYVWCPLRPARVGRSQLGRMVAAPLLLNRRWGRLVDVFHLHGDDWFYVARDVPTVRTFHGSARLEARTATSRRRRASQAILYPLERWSARMATAAYAVGPGMPEGYRLRGYLSLGVEVHAPQEQARAPEPAILFVGTWSGRKRGQFLYELFQREIRAALPTAELWMVSDECEPGEGVTHFSAPDEDTLRRLYQRGWVFCLPSTYEGFGLPYLEAMANGAPVVSTPNPGARYVTREGTAGSLVDDHDLARELIRLLTNSGARDALARRGEAVAREFSWEAAVTSHELAYMGAIERFRSRSARRERVGRT